MRLRIAYIFALSIAAHLVVTSADQALRQIAVQRLGWGIADSFCWTMLGFCWGAAAGASLAKRLQTRLAVGEVCIGATFWRLAIVVMLWVLLTSPYPWEFADWMLALLAVGLAASACLVFWWRLFAESLSMRTQHHYRATAALAGAVALAALAGSVTGPFLLVLPRWRYFSVLAGTYVLALLLYFPLARRSWRLSDPVSRWDEQDAVSRRQEQRRRRQMATILCWSIVAGLLLAAISHRDWLYPRRILADVALLGVWERMGWPYLGLGFCIAACLCAWTWHPRRILGWVPAGWTILVAGTAWWLSQVNSWGGVQRAESLFVCGIGLGWVVVPIWAAFLDQPAGIASTASIGRSVALAMLGFTAGPILRLYLRTWLYEQQIALVLLGTALALNSIAAGVAWRRLVREWLELVGEIVFLPVYRFRVVGPGLGEFPRHGPVLVVGNHASWMDPLWLGKVLPRRLIPMMGSGFYDLPVLRCLMRRVVRAIRVEEKTVRRDVPEIQEAIARLDQGECLVLFPEGMLRRSEKQVLRPFRRGAWQILRERPLTPVVPFWIEGGWGSYFSYWNGPPCKNKRMDWWYPVTIVVGSPLIVPAEILADQVRTRRFLEQAVLDQRHFLHADSVPLPSQVAEESD